MTDIDADAERESDPQTAQNSPETTRGDPARSQGTPESAQSDPESTQNEQKTQSNSAPQRRPETVVPAGATPLVCPHCGLELPDEKQYQLHLGLEHYERLDEGDREAFRERYRAEERELNRFRIVALGGLVVLYFGFLVVYALFAV